MSSKKPIDDELGDILEQFLDDCYAYFHNIGEPKRQAIEKIKEVLSE